MKWLKRKVSQQVWSETQIALYEKQMAAREALGTKYLCHPVNDAGRIPRVKFQGVEIMFDGPAQRVPLRLVK